MTNFPEKRLQVFVSSTFIDLKKERQAAVEAILAARHIPAGMELFAAGDASQMAVIRKWIDESDVFLLILGSRYGTVESTSGKSYIDLEFEYARDNGKPIIALLINEDIKKKREQRGQKLIDQGNSEKLKDFIKLVKFERYVSWWKDCKDIKIEIQKSLSVLSEKDELLGWIKRRINKEYDNFDVSIGGNTTIDIQIAGVDKAKAIRHLINDQKINPQDMIFFGDEFFKNGNDLSVALMEDKERPRFILNVGDKKKPIDPRVKDKIVTDGNGPDGTENYLRFILNQYF